MKEDSALFKYELAFTIIIKDAARYMKEWLDFHRLAGVDHFYFYDNESSDNLKEVLQPYIDSGVVEYEACPGKRPQCEAYNRAVKAHRFECRYMGFIDDDEFIYCADHNQTIKDVLHEVLDGRDYAEALAVDRYGFGSSGHEEADYSAGVLNRFVRRESKVSNIPKVIANPRAVEFLENVHYINLFDRKFTVNSNGQLNAHLNADHKLNFLPPVTDKIIMNHYYVKSREEWLSKMRRGDAFFIDNDRDEARFYEFDKTNNDVFDDGIIKYRDARRDLIPNGGGVISEAAISMHYRLFNSMMQKTVAGLSLHSTSGQFAGKLHEFLTCRHVARMLKGKLIEAESADFFEELSLKCAYRALTSSEVEIWQLQLLFSELPQILRLKYSIVDKIKDACIQLIPQMKMQYRLANNWRRYNQYDYLLEMLKGSD